MTVTIGLLLAVSFVLSLAGLAFLIWALSSRQITLSQSEAATIFEPGEEGRVDQTGTETHEPERPHHFDTVRAGIDAVSARPVVLMLAAATFWLILGSSFGMIASLKLHLPDWLTGSAPLTFGRMRTLHLNLVIYGWVSQAGLASIVWIMPRIFRTPLRLPQLTVAGFVVWNIGVTAGALAIATGWTSGLEWLEIPWQIDGILAIGAALFILPLVATTRARRVHHIYVSGWYFLGATIWFPVLFLVANAPRIHSGMEEATVNWWFAHNVLGLWLTPIGVGSAYYFIPKIIGKPIYSYAVSLLGFWGLALFYSQVGIHHLIGGPVPTWLVTLSSVHSVMMFVPVIAVAINHHITVGRNLWALNESVPLRFIAFGALMYTLASFQGSVQALRSFNSLSHFTHYTVAHAHLGVYAFVSLILFGVAYHILPRLTGRAFAWPRLINAHFWLSVLGFVLYFVALTIGGLKQGAAMLDPTQPFAESVLVTMRYLELRSVGGALMSLGHVLFALNVVAIMLPARAMVPAGAPAE